MCCYANSCTDEQKEQGVYVVREGAALWLGRADHPFLEMFFVSEPLKSHTGKPAYV